MRTPYRLSLLLLSFTLSAAHAGPGYPEYRVTVVGPANSYANDINAAGVVVGTYYLGAPGSSPSRGFVNRGNGLSTLGTLGGGSSTAVAINDKGQILGNWTAANGRQRGYIYYQGRQRDIGAVTGVPANSRTTYTDINNAGYTTANVFLPQSAGERSFLRTPGGQFRDLGSLSDAPATLNHALAINNRKQVVGESGPLTFPDQPLRAFSWTAGVMRDLGDFGFTPNGAEAINERGQVTGYMSLPEGFRDRVAFVYSNGRLINIDGRGPTEGRSSTGTGINNHGHVVGASNHLSGFIWRGRRMESLNALIDRRLGWDIYSPQAINDAGQIAANATRNGVQYAVRLDLIRPHGLAAPALDAVEAEDAVSPAQAQAEAEAEAAAQAREARTPVRQ